MAASIYIPTNSLQGFSFLHTLTSTCYLLSFDNSHSNRCEVIVRCGFNLHFLTMSDVEHPFPCTCWNLYVFFEKKMSIQILCPFIFYFFINLFIYLFVFWLCWVFVAALRVSLVAASGGYSSLQCVSFSLRWLLLLQSTSSRHAGFSSCSTQAQ